MAEVLHLLFGDDYGGRIEQQNGRVRLIYDEGWRRNPRAYPLSTRMPLVLPEHGDDALRPFLQGLLPDDPEVRRRWGRDFGVSGNNAFALLAHVGEDCPGACRFVREDRLDAATLGDDDRIDWLAESALEERVAEIEADRSRWYPPRHRGYFSLAGAQAKFALLRGEDGRWGIPQGRIPTSHIVKPAIPGLPGILENERDTLRAARDAGLTTAPAEIVEWGERRALVVERYDRRRRADGTLARVHQEDFCQALGVPPDRKYQNEGGPSPAEVARVLRDYSVRPEEDVRAVHRWLRFSVEYACTDGHGKNLSLLIEPEGQVRLAPFYDMASMLPYGDHIGERELRMSMKIGGEYHRHAIGPRHWDRLREELGL